MAKRGFSIRQRQKLVDPGDVELTLKYWSVDLFTAAHQLSRVGSVEDVQFEEDIGPLQIARQGQPMCLPEKKSIQSRFAVSVEQNIEPDKLPTEVGPVLEMFPNLRDDLKETPGPAISDNERLISGPTVLEWVFGGTTVRLSNKIEGKFALSLWYFVDSNNPDESVAKIEQGELDARISEISFDVKLKDGPMPGRAAQRALDLFSAMQENLPVNRKDTSKTALASPCKA